METVMKLLAISLFSLFIIAGCGDDNSNNTASNTDPAFTAFQTVEDGHFSDFGGEDIDPILITIENQLELEDFWFMHTSGTSPTSLPPEVDFDNEMVIALIDAVETSGGFSIQIQSMEDEDQSIIINATKVTPGSNCVVAAVMTQPFHIIKTFKTEKPLTLKLTAITEECKI